MNKLIAILISFVIVVIPFAILYYLISYGIVELFGKETYVIIICILALYFIVQDMMKKIKSKK